MNYQTRTVKKKNIDLDEIAFAIDTAGSWDGEFPRVGKGDYVVTIGSIENEDEPVLVSRRYTSAIDDKNAAELALSAWAERHDYETDDKGNLVEIEFEGEKGIPVWVVSVDKVV